MENYVEAGKIAREAREYGKKLVKENVKLLDIAEKIEEKIRELKGICAFPVDVSVNEIAAHYSPRLNEETKLKKGDLVKLDIGVHVDGYVVDTACTVEVGSENNKGVGGNGEDGRDGVHREYQVGRLDQDQHQEQRREIAHAIFHHAEFLAVIIV